MIRTILIGAAVGLAYLPGIVSADDQKAQSGGSAKETVDFVKQIKPILERNCVRCHGPEESKGDFQLHTKETFFRGGLEGAPVEPGDAEASLLFELISLGPDEEGRMPPEGDPLSKEEIELIKRWINEGAKWPDGVELSVGPARKKDPIDEMLNGPGLEVTPEEQRAIQKMQSLGALVLPIAQKTNWVRIDFSLGATHVTDDDLADLPAIRNLVELDLGGTKITDRALQYVGQCKNLVRLHLERTAITDAGLVHLANLPYLTYLNLYGTKVSDKGLEHLKKLQNLRQLYVWQTQVTPNGVKALRTALPQLKVVTGWEAQVATAEQSKKEAKDKKEQPAQAEQKKQAQGKPPAQKAKQPAKKPEQKKPAQNKDAQPAKKPQPASDRPKKKQEKKQPQKKPAQQDGKKQDAAKAEDKPKPPADKATDKPKAKQGQQQKEKPDKKAGKDNG